MESTTEDIDPASLHKYATSLFAQKRDLIDRLYVSGLDRKPLIYYIVLNEDTFDNRDSVYDVLSELQDASSLGDVHFSFYPPTLKDSLTDKTPIFLQKASDASPE